MGFGLDPFEQEFVAKFIFHGLILGKPVTGDVLHPRIVVREQTDLAHHNQHHAYHAQGGREAFISKVTVTAE